MRTPIHAVAAAAVLLAASMSGGCGLTAGLDAELTTTAAPFATNSLDEERRQIAQHGSYYADQNRLHLRNQIRVELRRARWVQAGRMSPKRLANQ